MPRLPIGPANVAPPLCCERLEDRSLLSSTSGLSAFGPFDYCDPVPGEELVSADRVVLESGLEVVPIDQEIHTLEWIEGGDGFISDEEYWDESWYYEEEVYVEDEYYEEEWDDSWYCEEEVYFEDEFYEEYWDDSWYYEDEIYVDETWSGEDEGLWTPEEYEEVWLDWDRSDLIPVLYPGDDTGTDWSWTQEDFEDGMVYAMAGGIALPDGPATPAAPTITDTVDLLPLPVPTSETDAGVDVAPALPPAATTTTPRPLPDVTAPRGDESSEVSSEPVLMQSESDEADAPALAPPTDSDDHLTEAESLELSEDLPVG